MDIPLPTEQRISPLTTPHFYNEHDALALLKSIRWQDGLTCPRCGSADVREVRTARVIEALSCRECRYNFTTMADSYFHGSRLPLFEHMQFITAVALEPDASASRLARFFDWKPTTVSRQLARLNGLVAGDFVHRLDGYQTFEAFASARAYLEQPAIAIVPKAFEGRIRDLLTPRGRTLRRKAMSKTPKSKSEAIVLEKFSPLPRRLPLVSPSTLPYLSDNDAAYDLVDSLRWDNKKRVCPRCDSRFVLPVKREQLRELYRCVDCHYMFNSLAGTIFQGTKMPVHKFLQFFIIYNALGERIRIQDICFVLECTFKTASLWLERGRAFAPPENFAFIDVRAAARLQAEKAKDEALKDPFFLFCEMRGIVVNEAHLTEYIKRVCRTAVNVRRA